MSGVLARIIAQAVVFTAGVFGRAFQEAYAKAQRSGGAAAAAGARGGARTAGGAQGGAGGAGGAAAAAAPAAAGRMPLDQARAVLALDKDAHGELKSLPGYPNVAAGALDARADAIREAFARHHKLNDPDESGGSLYVQAKVFHAKEALMADLKEQVERMRAARAAAAGSKLR